MAKFDDFDLDIRKVKRNMGDEAQPATVTGTLTTCTMPTICDTSIVTVYSCEGTCVACGSTEGGCTGNTCSACHSYCGGACRR